MDGIRRPLPELERARLQLQSPMPSNLASPKPSNPDKSRGIQAFRHPSIPDCRNPSFDHLKGEALGPSRGPQGISRCGPPAPLPSPWPPNATQGGPNVAPMSHKSIPDNQKDEHPGIKSSIPQSQRSAAEAVAYK